MKTSDAWDLMYTNWLELELRSFIVKSHVERLGETASMTSNFSLKFQLLRRYDRLFGERDTFISLCINNTNIRYKNFLIIKKDILRFIV